MGRSPPRALRDLLLQAEREVAGYPVEYAIAFDALGNEVLRKEGSIEEVPLTKMEQSALCGAIIVHNHLPARPPNGAVVRDIPPSADDLDILLVCGAWEVRVVTENYQFALRARPDPRFRRPSRRVRTIRDRWQRQYNDLWRERLDQLHKRYGAPLPIPIDIAFYEGIPDDAHKAWKMVADECRLYYRRRSRHEKNT